MTSAGAADAQPTSAPEPDAPLAAQSPSATPEASDTEVTTAAESMTVAEVTPAGEEAPGEGAPVPETESATPAAEDGARNAVTGTETPEAVAQAIESTAPPTASVALDQTAPEPQAPVPFIRYVEVGLVTLTLLLGFAAWLTRK
jgi:cobalamin biosynthesis Mg chelatase CobN